MPPTNFSSSGSVFGPPPLGMRSYSLRSAWYCSAGVGGLSWPLPPAATTDRLSIRTRVPLTARCTGVLHNPPARTTDEVGPRNTAAQSGRRGNGTQQHTGNLRAGQRRIEPRRTRNRAGSREALRFTVPTPSRFLRRGHCRPSESAYRDGGRANDGEPPGVVRCHVLGGSVSDVTEITLGSSATLGLERD